MKKYFHKEVDEYVWEDFVKQGKTWKWLLDNYKQPNWCSYENALGGVFGCWSLLFFLVKKEDLCKNCLFYKEKRRT